MRVYDYKLTDFDLTIVNGDFAVDESTEQHMQLLILFQKGELKQHPLAGVGIRDYLLDDRSLIEFESSACAELENDGINIKVFSAPYFDAVEIDGEYGG